MAASTMDVRNTQQSRADRLARLKSKEFCQGKSKFFLEHQVLREKDENKGYDANIHGWRYACQLPLPKGMWPDASKFGRNALDQHAKEEAARRHKKQNKLHREEECHWKRTQEELLRQQERIASWKSLLLDQHLQEERVEAPLSKTEESHVSNVRMAVCFINCKNPGIKYKFKEITAKNTIVDFSSMHVHYNFIAYSSTNGFELLLAEVDVTLKCESRVLQCCTIQSGPHGCCMGCRNQGAILIHPSIDKFIAGQDSLCTDTSCC